MLVVVVVVGGLLLLLLLLLFVASNVAVRGGNLIDKEAGGGFGGEGAAPPPQCTRCWGAVNPKVLDAGLLLLLNIVISVIRGTVSGKGRGGRSKAGEGLGGGRGAPNVGVVAAALPFF